MTDFPDVKLKALVAFPASVNDGAGIDVTKENGAYRFNLDFSDFAPPTSSIPDPANQNVLIWNAVTGAYLLSPVDQLVSGSTAGEYITPEQYDPAAGTGGDDTVAIQSAIDAAIALGGATVRFGAKGYRITSTIDIDGYGVRLVGSGMWATILYFNPTDNDTMFNLQAPANLMNDTYFSDFYIWSGDTAYTKIAFDIHDGRGLQMQRVRVSGVSGWTGGTGSIAVNVYGRDFLKFDNACVFYADRPLLIHNNPDSFIDCDHWDFEATLVGKTTHPLIEVEDGVYLSNLTVRGSWNLGTHGFYFHNTTSTATSHGVAFRDIRVEQGTATNWSFYYYTNGLANGLELDNFWADGSRKGFYLHGHNYVQMTRCSYPDTTKVALDADLITHLNIENCLWQTGSTASLGTLKLIYGGPIAPINGPLPATAYYSTWPVAEFNLGAITVAQSVRTTAPVTKTGDFTVATTENYLICNKGSSTTVTLPAAALFTGRQLWFKTIQAFTVVSASSNVVPNTSASAGTAILPATDGAWCMMVSDGTNWVIMASSTLV